MSGPPAVGHASSVTSVGKGGPHSVCLSFSLPACLASLFLPPVHLTLSLHTFNQAISFIVSFYVPGKFIFIQPTFLIQSRYIPKSIQNSSSQHAHLFHCSPSRCSDPCGGKSVSVSDVIYVHPTHLADPATSVKSRGVFLMLGRKILSLRRRKLCCLWVSNETKTN